MLKSAMKKQWMPLSKCIWSSPNQRLSKMEGSFENWTTLR